MNGFTNSHIDQFRLHHQQTFQLIFADLSNDLNYRIFMIIMEGFIFYSSQSVVRILKNFKQQQQNNSDVLFFFHLERISRSIYT